MDLNLANLLFVLVAAWMGGALAVRMGYPAVLGELLIGILLGPPILGLLQSDPALTVLAEMGILIMMLYVGMEIDPSELGKASWGGFLAAIGGFVTPFVMAYFTVLYFGGTPLGGVFVGIAAGVTSLTTKSRILLDLRLLDTRIASVMMSGALIADTLSLVVFAGVLGTVEAGTFDVTSILRVGAQVIAFFTVTSVVGLKVFPYVGRKLTQAGLTNRTFHFTLALILAVAFGELAHLAGLHAVLGAFIAGLFLRESVLGATLARDLMGAVRDASIGFLAPIFFVTAGFQVSLSVFGADLALFLSILAVATFGKIIGTAVFYAFSGNGWREGLTIGGGMNGRGAVEIIIAGIALEMGIITQELFSILVFMAIFTTATVPFLLKWGTDWLRNRGDLVRSGDARRGAVILGAGPLSRSVAKALSVGRPVWLIDRNMKHCDLAKADGLHAVCGNALEEQVLSEAGAASATMLLAMTSNAEINALAAQMARSTFLVPEAYVAREEAMREGDQTSLTHLGASALFGTPAVLAEWDHHLTRNEVREERLAVDRPMGAAELVSVLNEQGVALPIVVYRNGDADPVHADSSLLPGDEVVYLVRAR
jgi:Kef-type K+ transport system membrane component KefB/Trk K+ transport system NAD-binding subunit